MVGPFSRVGPSPLPSRVGTPPNSPAQHENMKPLLGTQERLLFSVYGTPLVEPEAPMSKTASLVFFYFGESSYVNRLAQETVPLHNALKGYDRQILLRHETDVGPFELSEKAEQEADVVDLPTKKNLVKYLNQLGDEGYIVDLYIFSHGSRDRFRVSRGKYGNNDTISQKYLEVHVRPLKLRMVWQCNCWGSTLNDLWLKLGAKACAGSRYVNFYPTTFKPFIKAWNAGEPLAEAVASSQKKFARTPVHLYLIGDAVARRKEWKGSWFGGFGILGRTKAARKYFSECWLGSAWRDQLSGKGNINYASKMVIGGSGGVTKTNRDLSAPGGNIMLEW